MPAAPRTRPGLPRRYGRLLGRATLVALAIAWLQAAAAGCPAGPSQAGQSRDACGRHPSRHKSLIRYLHP